MKVYGLVVHCHPICPQFHCPTSTTTMTSAIMLAKAPGLWESRSERAGAVGLQAEA